FSAQPELLSELVVPEINTPELKPASSDCEAACGNYVTLCLMLVPGASEELFSDGLDSCLGECATWDAPKVECMINSFDCPAMTNVCGL
ncbi:MAG: hypothetical protein Q7T50_01685, partial [Candidatus Magasanikbacteria bacterium]|nr:hypothetical protein [Candidatus Magasanikbacteria bacterium]